VIYTMRAVSVPLIPGPLDQLRQRRFSFYPPIVNVEHNEWILQRATWTEVQVVNTKTSVELCVPRQFVGEVSLVDEPVVIVGLVKELEYKEGLVLPHARRVIEMPRAANDSFQPRFRWAEPARPAPVIGIRLESNPESRTVRRLRAAIAAGILACVSAAVILRDATVGSRMRLSAAQNVPLPFTAQDTYDSIINRIGPPAKDRRAETGGVHYRRLWYPQRSFSIVLMGTDPGQYIGAVDLSGRVIQSIELPDGRNSAVLLRRLR